MPIGRLKHNATEVPYGIGLREEQVHVASGLRIATVTAMLGRGFGAFHPGIGVIDTSSVAAEANTGVWKSVTALFGGVWSGRLPVPMTPTIRMLHVPSADTAILQLRVSGYDQFGSHIVETSPPMKLEGLATPLTTADGFYHITMSKVFSYVDNIEFRGQNLGFFPAGPVFECGWSVMADPSRAEAAAAVDWFVTGLGSSGYNTLGTTLNWGIGTPLRVSPYGTDPIAPSFATGTITSSGVNVTAADTVTIDGKVYTFRASLTAGVANEVLIGASAAASLQNLFDAINYSGTPGTQYTAVTEKHPSVRASAITSTTVVVTARVAGSAANSIATSESSTTLSWAGSILSGGVDSGAGRFPEYLGGSGVLLRQINTPTIINTAAKIHVDGIPGITSGAVLGRSAPAVNSATGVGITYSYPAWQGTPHKIGINCPITATGTITSSGVNVTAADTVTIDGKVYTFRAALNPANANEVLVGASAAASLQNLFDAINYSGTPGTQYTAVTDRHTTVNATGVTTTVLTLTARTPGQSGGLITLAKVAATYTLSGATLTVSAASPFGAYGLSGSSTAAITATTDVDEDEYMLTFTVRSRLGTQADANFSRNPAGVR